MLQFLKKGICYWENTNIFTNCSVTRRVFPAHSDPKLEMNVPDIWEIHVNVFTLIFFVGSLRIITLRS